MPISEDDQFETYLKRFVPVAAEPIPALTAKHASGRSMRVGAWLAAFASIVAVAMLLLHESARRVIVTPNSARELASAARHTSLQPLTIRSANAWLAKAPSFKAALNDLAFRRQNIAVQPGQQSAVAVLSKEKSKL